MIKSMVPLTTTVEADSWANMHPWEAGEKGVLVTRANRLRDRKNTEFVWKLRKTGFCPSGR